MKKRTVLFSLLFIIAVLCSFFALHSLAANQPDTNLSSSFLTDKHLGIGCEISYKNGKMILNVNSTSAHVETEELDSAIFDQANSLKIVFNAFGKCSGVRLFAVNSDGEYTEEAYTEVKSSKEDITTCYLPLRKSALYNIRIVFEDLETETVEIHSITPYSISLPSTSYPGQIDTCAINSSSNEVLIIGRIKNSELGNYEGKELHLFEQPLCDDTTPETLSQIKSSLKTTVGSGEFIFRIKCNKKEDLKAYLFKKYTVAVKQDDSFVILDSPKCITNPDALSKQTATHSQTSGKGQYGESLSFMQDNMITDTSVTVDIGKFFSHLTSTGTKYECGGNVFYYNSDYIEQIDSILLPYAKKGIAVTLIITLGDSGNDSLNKTLVHPDSDLDARSLAFNTESRSSLSYLRAFCEFFAQRYCVNNPCVTRAVYGKTVANAQQFYNMGEKNLSDFTESYAKAFFTVHNAFKSVSKNVGIYTYIDNVWDTGSPFYNLDRFDNKAFLISLNNCISDYGNIDWGIILDPYPQGQKDYLAYADQSAASQQDRVYLSNLEIFSDFLKTQDLLFNNAPREFLIIEETHFESIDEKTVAADYVFGYYKAKSLSAEAFITNRSTDFNDVMKYVDTSLSLQKTEFALGVLNTDSWSNAIKDFNINSIIYKNYSHSDFTRSPENVIGRINISNFSSDTASWSSYGINEELSAGREMSERIELLSVKLGQIPAEESRGILREFDSPLDMSLIPIIHFDVNIASLPPNVDRAKLTVKFTSSNEVIEFSGPIDKAVWTDIYCDLSDFQGISNISSVSILLSGERGESFDSPQLFVSSIEGLSLEYDSDYLNDHFMAPKEESPFKKIIQEYAIAFLVAIICVCSLILSYRLHRTKE